MLAIAYNHLATGQRSSRNRLAIGCKRFGRKEICVATVATSLRPKCPEKVADWSQGSREVVAKWSQGDRKVIASDHKIRVVTGGLVTLQILCSLQILLSTHMYPPSERDATLSGL